MILEYNKYYREIRKGNIDYPMPHSLKARTVKKYGNEYQCNVLIETGTYMGDLLKKCYNSFDYLSSIEISETLYERAKRVFKKKKKIHLYFGDSGKLLGRMITDSLECYPDGKIVFWLDGHYSADITGRGDKDTPIMEELDLICKTLDGRNAIILIDDARCFVHDGEYIDYPTIPTLEEHVAKLWHSYDMNVSKDIIRIVI